MNRRGAYSGIIASIAIVAIIAIAFSSSATVKAQSENDYSKAIIDVKKNWLNARYLLDKSASDALADASTCNNIDTSTVESYLSQTLTGVEAKLKCYKDAAADIRTSGVGGRDVTITVTIRCEREIGLGLANYIKEAKFEKKVYIAATPCDVDVEDRDSGICEVDPDGDGCS